MWYITKEDLITSAKERFIDESTLDEEFILDNIEKKKIGILKSLLKSRYDVDKIFNETEPIRDEVIVSILVRLILAEAFGRNAARKIPTSSKEDATAAMGDLKDLSTGKVVLAGLPGAVDASGKPVSLTMFGNNTNKNFYI